MLENDLQAPSVSSPPTFHRAKPFYPRCSQPFESSCYRHLSTFSAFPYHYSSRRNPVHSLNMAHQRPPLSEAPVDGYCESIHTMLLLSPRTSISPPRGGLIDLPERNPTPLIQPSKGRNPKGLMRFIMWALKACSRKHQREREEKRRTSLKAQISHPQTLWNGDHFSTGYVSGSSSSTSLESFSTSSFFTNAPCNMSTVRFVHVAWNPSNLVVS
ncbi:hypothetical protein FRB94_014717 [Tulasnella sp. JGI-2019a]|nr:hypothetical protein FRB94_014717 [Tulasnella sp. JGI-2019a]